MSIENPEDLVRGLEEFLKAQNLWGRSLGVAWSGGKDSTALALSMEALAPKFQEKWWVLHFDHGLRSEAERRGEIHHVETLARDRQWNLVRGQVSGSRGGEGVEAFARAQRMAFLRHQREQLGLAGILTAHHQNDQAETQLMRLLQGQSFRGLAGIPLETQGIFHPFLHRPVQDLTDFVTSQGVSWFEDSTNSQGWALRNRVRLHLVPVLNQVLPQWVGALDSLGQWVQEVHSLLDTQGQRFWISTSTGVRGELENFLQWGPQLRVEILLQGMVRAGAQGRLSRQSLQRALGSLLTAGTQFEMGGVQVLLEGAPTRFLACQNRRNPLA